MYIEFTKNTGDGDTKQRIKIQPNDVASIEETYFGTYITTRHSGSHTVTEDYLAVTLAVEQGAQQTLTDFTRAMFGVE